MAVDFAINNMKPEGALVVKLFHGSGYNELVICSSRPSRWSSPQAQGIARPVFRL
jgi:hypothetical protein